MFTSLNDNGRMTLAVLYTLAFMGMVGALFLREIPTSNRDLMLTMAGVMAMGQAAIFGFYFGSSKGAEANQSAISISKERSDSTLQEIAKAPVVAAAAAIETAKEKP